MLEGLDEIVVDFLFFLTAGLMLKALALHIGIVELGIAR